MIEILQIILLYCGTFFGYTEVKFRTYSSECHPRDKEEGVVAMLWLILINILIAHAVVKRTKARTLVWKTKTLLLIGSVQLKPQTRSLSYLPLLTN